MINLKALFLLRIIMFHLALILICCKDHNIEPEVPEQVSFTSDIRSIFTTNCALSGCHDGSVQFSLKTYSDIVANVVPGMPSESKIYGAITGTGNIAMPPSGSLTTQQVKLIEKWISDGAQQN
jgi:hypothetical protein